MSMQYGIEVELIQSVVGVHKFRRASFFRWVLNFRYKKFRYNLEKGPDRREVPGWTNVGSSITTGQNQSSTGLIQTKKASYPNQKTNRAHQSQLVINQSSTGLTILTGKKKASYPNQKTNRAHQSQLVINQSSTGLTILTGKKKASYPNQKTNRAHQSQLVINQSSTGLTILTGKKKASYPNQKTNQTKRPTGLINHNWAHQSQLVINQSSTGLTILTGNLSKEKDQSKPKDQQGSSITTGHQSIINWAHNPNRAHQSQLVINQSSTGLILTGKESQPNQKTNRAHQSQLVINQSSTGLTILTGKKKASYPNQKTNQTKRPTGLINHNWSSINHQLGSQS
ncbi:hypothetical protein CEXT_136841 [Caerostris extrusa]|uniref:Uncharacterized protein n=1 Tax=Caerostris extrusa TaxID=172846 RepID=A0AAV4PNB3_CAEEX|nr:hypothetical protein CEXT_136841 [Caerostris extrusa]